MAQDAHLSSHIIALLRQRLGDRMADYAVPPPIFVAMRGEFTAFDPAAGILIAQFPILESYLNPYGSVQGGMVAAAVDNVLGPLSMLVAPPNVTRRLRMIYSRPVTPDLKTLVVEAELLEQRDRWLFFRAEARSPEGLQLARSKARHWILEDV